MTRPGPGLLAREPHITYETLLDECPASGPIAVKQVQSLLTRSLNRCSATWAKEMCRLFDLGRGYDCSLGEARANIRDLRSRMEGST